MNISSLFPFDWNKSIPNISSRRLLFFPIAFLFLTLTSSETSGQRFFSVVFNQLPQDYQLYPRNQDDESKVPVSGIIEVAGYTYMSVIVSRNGVPVNYHKAPIRYNNNNTGAFATESVIKAELANYGFSVYACKGVDSVLIVARDKVVSGDAFVVMGQSNSTGSFSSNETDEFCRTFGTITGTLNTEAYNPADTAWALSNRSTATNVGAMGIEIQRQLAQQSGIPNCLINGGFHWSSAFSHAIRNEQNPTDLATAYGRMLYRVKKSGVSDVVRAFIYRQGETEAYGEGWNWEENFDKLYHNVKNDIPAIEKLYVFQIDIIYHPTLTGAILRDYQRRLPQRYPDIRTLATVGTKEFDGLHYGQQGNIQGGFEVSRLMNRDLYQSGDSSNIDSPDIKKAFYKTPERTELVLVFDEGQQLVYPAPYKPNDHVTLEMGDFFYFDGWQGIVDSGKAEDNRVTLVLKNAQNTRRLTYLPPYLQEGGQYYPFTGPFITNKKGMRAFTFYEVAIRDALGTPNLTATKNGLSVNLEWSRVESVRHYVLERKKTSETGWTTVSTPDSATLSFDDVPPAASSYQYRLKAINDVSESGDYGHAEVKFELITGVYPNETTNIKMYPNPVSQTLTLEFGKPVSGNVYILDKNGRQIKKLPLTTPTEMLDMPLNPLAPGSYLLLFDSPEIRFTRKLVVSP